MVPHKLHNPNYILISMVKRFCFSLLVLFAVVLTSCSGSKEAKDTRTTITGHAEAIAAEDVSPEQKLSALNNLWLEANASPELAKCYTDFFEAEGLAKDINTLEDLATAQANFTEEQKQAFGDCGSNVE